MVGRKADSFDSGSRWRTTRPGDGEVRCVGGGARACARPWSVLAAPANGLSPGILRRMPDLAAIALALPDVQQGVACAGTTLASRTFAVRNKTFLFLSAKEARLKLEASLAAAGDAGHGVGANGWVKLDLGALPTIAVLRRWIAESHALMAGASRPAAKRQPKARRQPIEKPLASPRRG